MCARILCPPAPGPLKRIWSNVLRELCLFRNGPNRPEQAICATSGLFICPHAYACLTERLIGLSLPKTIVNALV